MTFIHSFDNKGVQSKLNNAHSTLEFESLIEKVLLQMARYFQPENG